MRVDQCFSAVRAVEALVILRAVSCSNDTSVARMFVEWHQVIPGILDDLCSLPYVAPASGGAEVDTWPQIQSGCYHMTEIGGPYGL